jgi:hypothetical protein
MNAEPTTQTKLNDLEMSVPKKVTAGWACRVVMYRALSASSGSLSSDLIVPRAKVESLGPPTPAKRIVAF